MSDAAPEAMTAGRLLREARQAQGMHIAALASAIKVAPRKLELLEADRFDELPDATFTRALAQTVCRALKIDPAPVLAMLPRPDGNRLGDVGGGLNTPFRERSAGLATDDLSALSRPAVWAPVLLLLAAAVVYFLPAGFFEGWSWHRAAAPASAPAVAAPAPVFASAPEAVTTVAAESAAASGTSTNTEERARGGASSASPDATEAPIAAAVPTGTSSAATLGSPSSAPAAVASLSAASAPVSTASTPAAPVDAEAHLLVLRARGDTWIEVVDARGKALLSRTVKGGESVGLDGTAPLRLRIGNAPATEVVYRGQPVDLAPRTSGNIARLELH
jgi:cytoskeleton protein RodZ